MAGHSGRGGTSVSFVYSPRRYEKLIRWIEDYGDEAEPRGMKTTEVLDAHLILNDPRDRIIFDPARKMNIAFAIAEWAQVMAGNDSLDYLSHFAERMKDFADPEDPTRIGGAYGPRVRPLLDVVVDKLQVDPNTRQAIIQIYKSEDIANPPNIIPCTLSLQFLLRYGELNLIAHMRSNDAVWGLTYDVFMFTMIQEWVATKLGVKLGWYHHNDGSLHIYTDRDSGMLGGLNDRPNKKWPRMNEMDEVVDADQLFRAIQLAREWDDRPFWDLLDEDMSQYTKNLALTTRFWSARKAHDGREMDSALNYINDPAILEVLKLWSL